MNSDMSKRISDFSLPNMNCARVRATSVLPTPVGPRNRNEPMGRLGLFRPARERRMARASAEMALVLRDDPLVQLFLDAQQLLAILLP